MLAIGMAREVIPSEVAAHAAHAARHDGFHGGFHEERGRR
jgi:hypothetical protein